MCVICYYLLAYNNAHTVSTVSNRTVKNLFNTFHDLRDISEKFRMTIDWNAVNIRLPHEKGDEGKKKRKVRYKIWFINIKNTLKQKD